MAKHKGARSVRAFIFDLGNVMLDFDFNPAFAKLSRATGVPQQEIRDYFVQSGLEVLFDGGKITPLQFFREVCRALKLKISYARFAAIWNDIFTPDRRMAGLVRRLRRGHRMVLLSNTNAMHAKYFERRYKNVIGLFHKRLYSFREKLRKPDAELYRRAVRACGVPKNRVFYVDDRADFTQEAQELGIASFTYRKNFGELCAALRKRGALA